jgi:hypothetical protein
MVRSKEQNGNRTGKPCNPVNAIVEPGTDVICSMHHVSNLESWAREANPRGFDQGATGRSAIGGGRHNKCEGWGRAIKECLHGAPVLENARCQCEQGGGSTQPSGRDTGRHTHPPHQQCRARRHSASILKGSNCEIQAQRNAAKVHQTASCARTWACGSPRPMADDVSRRANLRLPQKATTKIHGGYRSVTPSRTMRRQAKRCNNGKIGR